MKVTHYTEYEGGEWKEAPKTIYPKDIDAVILPPKGVGTPTTTSYVFNGNELIPLVFHSIRTADGREWDTINGWRDK